MEQIIKDRTKELNGKNLQLEEQSEKLQEMARVKSRFFANISHEFRTPLTLIMGPLEQMLGDKRDQQAKKKLTLIFRSPQRLLTLINQLLDLSKFDSGRMRLQASRQPVVPFLKGIAASFELLARQNNIEPVFHADKEDIQLYFDTEKLEEVICNLILNALKFTPSGGRITLSVKESPTSEADFLKGYLEITVSDTGIGLSREQLSHIFERFYQADGNSDCDHNGFGIGLALTREMVVLHCGRIDVHSWQGKGTEFIIRLPMGKAHLKPEEIVDSSHHTSEGNKSIEIQNLLAAENDENNIDEENNGKKISGNNKNNEPGKEEKNVILVVEDNADVRQYIKEPLEILYKVVEAVNGEEGIKKAKELIPDLIISDIMMPVKDGYELCAVLKKEVKTSHIPIILLTAKASEDSMVQGLETGADDYITKPFSTKILTTRIKNLIDLRRQLQEKIQRKMMLQPAEISVSSVDKEFIKELQGVIEKNLSDTLFNVEKLGKKLYMSRATLYRKVHALTGESPREFIRSYRLKRGAQLLKANSGNVTEVAFEVGFSSSSYFIKCFKDKFHQSPHSYQATEGAGNK
ncbi:MAG: response regulator [bacterium]|nr:response regulator [bacterium]